MLKFDRSAHQQRVEEFMRLAGQELPVRPTEPDEKTRLLRAKLIFEEAMETICGLGVCIRVRPFSNDVVINSGTLYELADVEFDPDAEFSMEEIIDGCCDLAVVTTGTLSAIGVPDLPFQELIDENNLAKFGPGHYIADGTPEKPGPVGKLIKPPGHKSPDIAGLLESLSASLQ